MAFLLDYAPLVGAGCVAAAVTFATDQPPDDTDGPPPDPMPVTGLGLYVVGMLLILAVFVSTFFARKGKGKKDL